MANGGYGGYGAGGYAPMGISQAPFGRPMPTGPVGPWQGPQDRPTPTFTPPAQGPTGTFGGALPPLGIADNSTQLGYDANDPLRRYAALGLAQQLGPTGSVSGLVPRALPALPPPPMGIASGLTPANVPTDPGFTQPGGMFAPYGYGGQRQITGFGSTPWGISQPPQHLGGAPGVIPRGR